MTIQERMVARSEREKDLLKYGRSQERERIIKLLEGKRFLCSDKECCWLATEYACDCKEVIALIKGEK